jgi:hypothetical protein
MLKRVDWHPRKEGASCDVHTVRHRPPPSASIALNWVIVASAAETVSVGLMMIMDHDQAAVGMLIDALAPFAFRELKTLACEGSNETAG